MNVEPKGKKAMFGAGCFWGVEAAFRQLDGVMETTVGYSGGHVDDADYKQVCSGESGHAEVVLVRFDPAQVSYDDLLNCFWAKHDPTQLNKQGPDVGSQYRSAVYYFDDDQREVATVSKATEDSSGRHKKPVVTEIKVAGPFWEAEEYHQQYLEKRGLATCSI